MNVGIRYPEGRTGRPSGYRRTTCPEEEGGREGGPEGLRQAHQARAEHGPEDVGALGADGMARVFGAVLTDNGSEFADEGAIAALLGEREGETRLFYCDPRQSQQKGACERNHVEIRKLLPKGAGIRFDRLAAADCALLMSHVNSEPRGALGFATPARAFRAMLGADAAALLDAYGIEDVPVGELDLTPGLIARARAERGDAPLS